MKEDILDNQGLFSVPLEFHPKTKNWIFCHSTVFLNYTNALTNSVILLNLPNISWNLFFKLLMYILSAFKTGLRNYCDTSYWRVVVNQMYILKNSKDLLEYIKSISFSSCSIIWLPYPPHNYYPLKTKRRIKTCIQTVIHNKE